MDSKILTPGQLAIWCKGTAILSWPPDGHRELNDPLYGHNPGKDTLVFIVSKVGYHGFIVLLKDQIWWCPQDSLRLVKNNDEN